MYHKDSGLLCSTLTNASYWDNDNNILYAKNVAQKGLDIFM